MQDIYYIALWWGMLLGIGIISFPLTWYFFRNFFDRGYGLTKSVGILTLSYSVFLLAIARFAKFSITTIIITLIVFLVCNTLIFLRHKKQIAKSIRDSFKQLLSQELLFGIGLVFWSLIRGYQPDIVGLEKFMDFGFINSILRAEYLPPADIWFAGESINYYWFGHFVTAFLTKLSQIPSSVTYNLMLATIMGLALTSTFSLVTTLAQTVQEKVSKKKLAIVGLLSALVLVFGGNFHLSFFYARKYVNNERATCLPAQTCTEKIDTSEYWYPDATRFIGYDPETNDKTIHEFPQYSFVVSDLHAHLLNFPFVILYLSFLYLLVTQKKKTLPVLLTLGFLIGVFFMTNTWDVGNYLLVTGIVVATFTLHTMLVKEKRYLTAFFKAVFSSTLTLLTVLGAALITAIPFYIHFESIAQGVAQVNAHTPLWQLAVLWGFPFLLLVSFVITLLGILKKHKTMTDSDLFVFVLLVASFVLILIPEFIYVKDIYIASHHRANTMFKLTYQAFVMSYLVSGYVVFRVMTSVSTKWIKITLSLVVSIVFATLLYYPKFAIASYYANLETYRGIQGDTWLAEKNPEVYGAISWLNENVERSPVILEAPGDSYTEYNSVSAYTGLPTISGWFVHEWLWRGESTFPAERVKDIDLIYKSTDSVKTKELLTKYNVQYVMVGPFEREKYPALVEGKFEVLGERVFSQGTTRLYQILY